MNFQGSLIKLVTLGALQCMENRLLFGITTKIPHMTPLLNNLAFDPPIKKFKLKSAPFFWYQISCNANLFSLYEVFFFFIYIYYFIYITAIFKIDLEDNYIYV